MAPDALFPYSVMNPVPCVYIISGVPLDSMSSLDIDTFCEVGFFSTYGLLTISFALYWVSGLD